MKFRQFIQSNTNESEMKYQALAMAKEIHTELAKITFIEMLSVMDPSNPAKKEIQALETELNDLTNKVGEFIQKYIPDVADAEAGDTSEEKPEEEVPAQQAKSEKSEKQSNNKEEK